MPQKTILVKSKIDDSRNKVVDQFAGAYGNSLTEIKYFLYPDSILL